MDTERGESIAGALPVGLAQLPPGPGLAAVLAGIDRAELGADALVDLVAARARLLWHLQGELLADLAQAVIAELATRELLGPDQDPDEVKVVDEVGELVGWTLHWSTGYARGQVFDAAALATRLPMVLAAVRDGLIDQAKAAAFTDALSSVDDEVAVRIAVRLLPRARTWTLTQLRERLRYHVDRADPGAARRRYRTRVAQRDVYLRAQPDGTANLSGQGLAPHRAAAAYDRIDRIARAARSGGDVRTLAQLRGDVMCDVLAGVPFQLTPGTDPLTAAADLADQGEPDPTWYLPNWHSESRFRKGNPDADDDGGAAGRGDPHDGGPGPTDGGWPPDPIPPPQPPPDGIDLYDYDRACLTDADRAWTNIGWAPPGAADDETPGWWHACRPARAGAQEHRSDPDREPPAESRTGNGILLADEREDRLWAAAQADALHLGDMLSSDVLTGDRCRCGGRTRVRPGVVDVQVELTTLAGLDEHPAVLARLGVTVAPLARLIAFDPHTRPTWRWSIFDSDGDLLHHGLTRHRPTRPESRSEKRKTQQRWCACPRVEPGERRGTVELQLTLATLHDLLTNPDRAPGWQALLTDIAAQVTQDQQINPPGTFTQTGPDGKLLPHRHTRRMPAATEEAFIRARDRSCRAPHCRITAARCELDHRTEHAHGGPSHRGNVDCRCKRHHHLRHRKGYRITKTGRTTTWTIPSGRNFTVTTDKDLVLVHENR